MVVKGINKSNITIFLPGTAYTLVNNAHNSPILIVLHSQRDSNISIKISMIRKCPNVNCKIQAYCLVFSVSHY